MCKRGGGCQAISIWARSSSRKTNLVRSIHLNLNLCNFHIRSFYLIWNAMFIVSKFISVFNFNAVLSSCLFIRISVFMFDTLFVSLSFMYVSFCSLVKTLCLFVLFVSLSVCLAPRASRNVWPCQNLALNLILFSFSYFK